MFEEYPKWKYDGMEGILVADAEEETALGDGYTDAPSTSEAPPDRPKRGRPSKVKE